MIVVQHGVSRGFHKLVLTSFKSKSPEHAQRGSLATTREDLISFYLAYPKYFLAIIQIHLQSTAAILYALHSAALTRSEANIVKVRYVMWFSGGVQQRSEPNRIFFNRREALSGHLWWPASRA